MGKTVKIECDGCGANITTRSNCVDYRLVLSSESKPGGGAGAYTSMMIYPPIERTHYFCGLKCLDLWTARRQYANNLWKEFWNSWKEEHGTKDESGKNLSYPDPPAETKKTMRETIEAESLKQFPMNKISN